MTEVASSALSANALDLYLNEQLPGYESRLIAAGISAKNAKQESGQVRRLAAQGCIKRAVSAQNYQMAQAVYQKFSGCFSLAEKENLTGLIGAAQAGGKAQIYWDKSLAETDGSAEARLKWAQAQTADKAVLENLSALGAQAKREEFSKQAQEYTRLASALSAEDARQRLALSSLDAVGVTARAVSRFGAPAPHTSAETFNRLYFGGTEKDNQRAFEKGEISAQEFLVLSAARSFRQAGEQDKTGAFLCSGIDAWAQKRPFICRTERNKARGAVFVRRPARALKRFKTNQNIFRFIGEKYDHFYPSYQTHLYRKRRKYQMGCRFPTLIGRPFASIFNLAPRGANPPDGAFPLRPKHPYVYLPDGRKRSYALACGVGDYTFAPYTAYATSKFASPRGIRCGSVRTSLR